MLVHGRAGENYWGNADFVLQLDSDTNKLTIPSREQWTFGDVGVAARRHFRDWLKARYKTREKLREAWKMPDVDFEDVVNLAKWPGQRFTKLLMWHSRPNGRFTFRDRIEEGSFYHDFVQHHNEANAECFLAAAEAIKTASDNRLIVGGFIGYVVQYISNSTPGLMQHAGHLAYRKVLESPYFDFSCSPGSYLFRRTGDPVMPMGVVDSLRLHGKMWFNEFDTRTYRSPIKPKTFSVEETIEANQREFGYAITKNQGWWWLEFPFKPVGPQAASWFSDEDFLADAGVMKRVYDHYLTLDRPHEPNAECAIIFNVEQGYHTDADAPANTASVAISNYLIPKLFSLGPSFDIYAQSDLPLLVEKGWAQKYKMLLFVNSFQFTPAERELIETKLKTDGRTLLFLFAPGYVGNEGDNQTERSVAGIEGVTGMKGVRRLGEKHVLGISSTAPAPAGKPFDLSPWWDEPQVGRFGQEIGPVFYLDPAAANGWEPVATLRMDQKDVPDKIAVARLKRPDHQVYYSTVPDLPLDLLRRILQDSGAHLYTSKPGVYTWSNTRFLAVHAGQEEKGLELMLPSPTTWIEPFEGRRYAVDAKSITIDLKKGETKFFCLDRDGEWTAFAKS